MRKNAHDAVTIRYGATTVQAGSATTASRSPTNVIGKKVKTVDFSKTIAACDLKVGRCRQLS